MSLSRTALSIVLCFASVSVAACGGEVEGANEPDVDTSSAAITVQGNVFQLATHGGTGGTPADIACNAGDIAVGIFGSYSTHSRFFQPLITVVDRLGLICEHLETSGALTAAYTTVPVGDQVNASNPSAFYTQCAAGQAIVGLRGRSATYLDAIGIECAAAPFTRRASQVTDPLLRMQMELSAPLSGGTGGTPFTDECPAGEWAVQRITVRSGSWVDGFTAYCVGLTGSVPVFSHPVAPRPTLVAAAPRG